MGGGGGCQARPGVLKKRSLLSGDLPEGKGGGHSEPVDGVRASRLSHFLLNKP